MRILVLGAGATGGYFGGRMAEAGLDVSFLLRSARAARVAAEGLRIRSPAGDLHARVKTVSAEQLDSTADLVLLSCKAYDLDDAVTALTPAVGPDTAVLPVLNGLRHFDRLDAAFGAERVLGGLCHIGATLAPDGTVLHTGSAHALTFGERAGGSSARGKAIAAALAPARFSSRLSTEIVQDLWEKFAFLSALAGITCLMRAPVGTVLATRDGEAIIRELYAECSAVAAAHDHPPRPKAVEGALATLTQRGSAGSASMMRDLEGGGRVEADSILGDLLRRAEANGIAAPLLRVAFCHLQSYQARRASAPAT